MATCALLFPQAAMPKAHIPRNIAERLVRFKKGREELGDKTFIHYWFVYFELFYHVAQTALPAEKLDEIRAAVDGLDGRLEKQAEDEVRREINEFRKAKPHLEAVRPVMAKMLKTGGARDLEDAYWQAIDATEM